MKKKLSLLLLLSSIVPASMLMSQDSPASRLERILEKILTLAPQELEEQEGITALLRRLKNQEALLARDLEAALLRAHIILELYHSKIDEAIDLQELVNELAHYEKLLQDGSHKDIARYMAPTIFYGPVSIGDDLSVLGTMSTNELEVKNSITCRGNATVRNSSNFSVDLNGDITALGVTSLGNAGQLVVDTAGNLTTTGTITAGTISSTNPTNFTDLSAASAEFGTPVLPPNGQPNDPLVAPLRIDTLGNVSTNGSLFTSGSINAANGQFSVDTQGDLFAVGNIATAQILTARGLSVSNGAFSVTGNSTYSGPLQVHGSVTANSTISGALGRFLVDSSGDIITQGQVSIGQGTMLLDRTGNITSQGALNTGNGNFQVDASGNITTLGATSVAQNFSAGAGNFTIDSSGNITSQGALNTANGNFQVDTSGNITTLGATSVAQNFSAGAGNFTIDSSGNITNQGALNTANGNFQVDASGNMTILGSVKGQGALSFSTLSAAGGLFITDVSGDITAVGGSFASGAVTIDGVTGDITTTGALNAANGVNVPSKRQLKTDIKPLMLSSDILDQLEPVTYSYKADSTKKHFGLIADDLANILPTVVTFDAEQNPTSINYLELNIATLALLKNQKEAIDALRKDIKVLEQKSNSSLK
jgi:hypothetical protein